MYTHSLKVLNRHAGAVRHWAAVRYSASLLKHMVDSLSPYVTQILVNGKMVTVGTMGGDQGRNSNESQQPSQWVFQ